MNPLSSSDRVKRGFHRIGLLAFTLLALGGLIYCGIQFLQSADKEWRDREQFACLKSHYEKMKKEKGDGFIEPFSAYRFGCYQSDDQVFAGSLEILAIRSYAEARNFHLTVQSISALGYIFLGLIIYFSLRIVGWVVAGFFRDN